MFNQVRTFNTLSPMSQAQIGLMLRRMNLRGELSPDALLSVAIEKGIPADDLSLSDLTDLYEFSPTDDHINTFVAKEVELRRKASDYITRNPDLNPESIPESLQEEHASIVVGSNIGILLHHVISEASAGNLPIIVSEFERRMLELQITPLRMS
jgi:hypothetical protein